MLSFLDCYSRYH
jgi:hypothetical protein